MKNYKIKHPADFITTPWKNGLGETTELAINQGGSLADFDWRISMATVSENGVFSNFANYFRQLVLISGQGITLHHHTAEQQPLQSDELRQLLDIAEFDGGNITHGELVEGTIVDFNVITKQQTITSKVTPVVSAQKLALITTDLLQVYAVTDTVTINVNANNEQLTLAKGELFQWLTDEAKTLELIGSLFIVVELSTKK